MILSTEKNGKTLNLLKASAKKINPHKKRKVIPLLGNIKNWHATVDIFKKESKKKEEQENQNEVLESQSVVVENESEME